MEQHFRTIYFPADRTRSGVAERVTLSLPNEPEFLARLRLMSSAQIRHALGDPVLEDISDRAAAENRTLSNYCLALLRSNGKGQGVGRSGTFGLQQSFAFAEPDPALTPTLGLTFRDSKRLPFHRWYPYVEGFSASYVKDVLARLGPVRNVYDPFGGTGTCQLEASMAGIVSYYSEINPFMRFVAETKVNACRWARENRDEVARRIRNYLDLLRAPAFRDQARTVSLVSYERAFPERDYFEEHHLRELLAARDLASEVTRTSEQLRALILLAVAANVVRSSNMTRRADLRRRRPGEYKDRVVNVRSFVEDTLTDYLRDIMSEYGPTTAMFHVSDDAREVGRLAQTEFDLALTSPPYLNGTNYFRNTKLELWFLGSIVSEADLGAFRRSAVAAGINNVTAERNSATRFPAVEEIVARLEATDGDRRIPLLVRSYFSDMFDVLRAVARSLRRGGRFLVDIGDSKFYGVHVPTDSLLLEAGREAGFEVESVRPLARRYSYDKSELRQVEILLRRDGELGGDVPGPSRLGRHDGAQDLAVLRRAIRAFGASLPYKKVPYIKRNWGHPLHSLCSYQGKLKPAIAYWLCECFTSPGMTVLDPLGGVGTVAFEACRLGRVGFTNDLSPLAYAIASGKVNVPSPTEATQAVSRLAEAVRSIQLTKADREAAEFGINGTVADFYHAKTLGEVLKARRYYLGLSKPTRADLFVKASVLHLLHGNRPYALSRRSHPVTPFHPTGETKYKNLIRHVQSRITTLLAVSPPEGFVPGISWHGDFRAHPWGREGVDRIITSPPFMGMRFDRPNWLRMWFCGWAAADFLKTSRSFLERQQTTSLDVYRDLFATCAESLKPGGLMILHLGGSPKHEMLAHLIELAAEKLKLVEVVSEDVTAVERHGIRDKGLTTSHNFVFLVKGN